MYACMCVCMYVCMCVRTVFVSGVILNVSLSGFGYGYVYLCTYMVVCICTYVYIFIRVYTNVRCPRMCSVCVRTCVLYTFKRMRTVFQHMHVCMQIVSA